MTGVTNGKEDNYCKPFNAIPREKGLPYFGTFLKVVNRFNLHFLIPMERAEKHGKIWREQQLPGKEYDAVYIIDPEDVQEVFRVEGKTPHRMSIPGMQAVRTASAGPEGELGVLFS